MTSVTTMLYDAELHTHSYDENSNVYWCFRQNHSQFTRNVQESADPENFSSERFFIQSMHILVNLQCE